MIAPKLLLVEEVAAICRVSVSTVRYWLFTRKLPSVRPGRRRLVRAEDLERFLVEKEAQAAPRPEAAR